VPAVAVARRVRRVEDFIVVMACFGVEVERVTFQRVEGEKSGRRSRQTLKRRNRFWG
jgi:vacuolar-type H+-ATPase subunit B/Vma2